MKTASVIKTVLLIVAVGIIPLYVVFANIFPSFSFSLSRRNGASGIQVAKSTSGGVDYFFLNSLDPYRFSEIAFSAKTKDDQDDSETYQVEVAKGYFVNSLPLGQNIATSDELKTYLFKENPIIAPNGSLVSSGDSVYVISRGKYFPVVSPQIFEDLGYKWDKVVPISSEELGLLQVGDKIEYNSSHPDGTIIESNQGHFFLVWEGEKLPIKNQETVSQAWPGYYSIKVSEDVPEYFSSCLEKINKHRLDCNFSTSLNSNKLGNGFIFKVSPSFGDGIQDVVVRLNTKIEFNKGPFSVFLSNLKSKLSSRYVGKIFK